MGWKRKQTEKTTTTTKKTNPEGVQAPTASCESVRRVLVPWAEEASWDFTVHGVKPLPRRDRDRNLRPVVVAHYTASEANKQDRGSRSLGIGRLWVTASASWKRSCSRPNRFVLRCQVGTHRRGQTGGGSLASRPTEDSEHLRLLGKGVCAVWGAWLPED